MNMLFGHWLTAGVVSLAVVAGAVAQETAPAAPDDKYGSLRESEDRVTKRFADRYYNLIRQQEWTSVDNKQKVLAKYVAHDPNFKWVKLARISGSGANRVTREVTVPLEKLNKTCQSRVRQIAVLQPKLDELLAAEPGMAGDAGAEAGGEYGSEYGNERGRGMRVGRPGYDAYGGSEQGATESPSDAGAPAEASAEERPYSAAGTEVDTGANDPDPLGFGELANEPPLAPSGGEYGGYSVTPQRGGVPAAPQGYSGYDPTAAGTSTNPTEYSGYTPPADSAPPSEAPAWATSYDAFLANFTATQNSQGDTVIDFGELADLQVIGNFAEAARAVRRGEAPPGNGAQLQAQAQLARRRLSDVTWEATLQQTPTDANASVQLDVSPLPDPLVIKFGLDTNNGRTTLEQWSRFSRGDRVRFKGQLSMTDRNTVVVAVREPEAAAAVAELGR